MTFSLGKPILLMMLAAIVSGVVIGTRPPPPTKNLVLWTFTDIHAETYRSIIHEFEQQTGISVEIKLLNGRALSSRLESMFMSGTGGETLPDLVELEISWVGRFFRPPIEQVGFLPLNDLLRRGGWDRRIVRHRFAPWSKRGVIFGVPHDVHPVAIAYRRDLFEEAGVNLESARTWAELQEMCLRFQAYWRNRGYRHRHAMELPQASSEIVVSMLLQRGINLIDENENIYFTDPRVAETVAFYAQLVAGPRRIASESAGGTGIWTRDVVEGNLCALMMPDWRVFDLRSYATGLEGNMRMMPLPRFEPADTPTSTWGGTMIGIPRNSSNHEAAWKLIEFLYLSETGLRARQKVTNILPPVISQWDDPVYHRSDPFFGGQKVDELYIELAQQIPPRYVTPATSIAQIQLSLVLNRAVRHLRDHGEAGLHERIRGWLEDAEQDLRRRIAHGKMDEDK